MKKKLFFCHLFLTLMISYCYVRVKKVENIKCFLLFFWMYFSLIYDLSSFMIYLRLGSDWPNSTAQAFHSPTKAWIESYICKIRNIFHTICDRKVLSFIYREISWIFFSHCLELYLKFLCFFCLPINRFTIFIQNKIFLQNRNSFIIQMCFWYFYHK